MNEMNNLDVDKTLCVILDEFQSLPEEPYSRLIAFVKERPGQDQCCAINSSKIQGIFHASPERLLRRASVKQFDGILIKRNGSMISLAVNI
jgi:dTDP-D-glucose 4,6-dehydratase